MTSDQDARSQLGMPASHIVPTPPPPGSRYPLRRRRRTPWLIALLVLLVVAGVLTTLLVRANQHQTANQPAAPSGQPTSATTGPSPSGTTGSPSPVAPPLLARGQEAPGSAIPWSQVNAGWQLAGWSSQSSPNLPPRPSSILYLVNPIGGRYRIATLPPQSMVALWSPDLRRAMVTTYDNTQTIRREYDLSTGRQLASFVAGGRRLLSYADPSGHSLLLIDPADGAQPQRLELVSTAGMHQRYLPGNTPQAGSFVGSVLYLRDSSAFLIGSGTGFAVISNSGTVIRQIGRPTGTRSCQLSRWWTTGTALASCLGPADSSAANLFTIPLDGRPPAAITYAPPPRWGFSGGWRYSGGIVAAVAGSCGPGGFELLDSAGHARSSQYQPPVGVSGQEGVTGVYLDQVNLLTGNCGASSRSLYSVDLRTGATSALLGPGLNGGSVTNVVTVSGR